MGLDRASLVFLKAIHALGVDFRNILQIGRQNFNVSAAELDGLFGAGCLGRDTGQALTQNPFCEDLFGFLGARRVASLDYSAFEGASLIHDLNVPVPLEQHNRYTLVYDGGTLEHVFNVAQAFKNCLEMVQVGGHFAQVSPASNYCGHGFWQFSPELVFRALASENGFEVVLVLLHEVAEGGGWFLVQDPAQVGRRIELRSDKPLYLLTLAKRIAQVPVFARWPQQSDYQALWAAHTPPPATVMMAPSMKTGTPTAAEMVPRGYRRIDEQVLLSPDLREYACVLKTSKDG